MRRSTAVQHLEWKIYSNTTKICETQRTGMSVALIYTHILVVKAMAF